MPSPRIKEPRMVPSTFLPPQPPPQAPLRTGSRGASARHTWGRPCCCTERAPGATNRKCRATRPPGTRLAAPRRPRGRGSGRPGAPCCRTAPAWPAGLFLGGGVELFEPGASRNHSTTQELPASGLPDAVWSSPHPHPAGYLGAGLSPAVQGSRGRHKRLCSPAPGWCKAWHSLLCEPRAWFPRPVACARPSPPEGRAPGGRPPAPALWPGACTRAYKRAQPAAPVRYGYYCGRRLAAQAAPQT